MNICIITHDYPDKERSVFTFVQQLVEEFVNQGNNCYVISPYSITKNRKTYKKREIIEKGNGCKIVIYRPNYISISDLNILGITSDKLHKQAVTRAFKWLPKDIDCIYCHFWNSAIEAYPYAKRNHIPLFVATGESEIPNSVCKAIYQPIYDYISGVICVSSKNRDESIEKKLTINEKCIVIPNAINNEIFKQIDKAECRKKIGIPQDAFIVISVGWFSERKGTKRISEAINKIQDGEIYSIFIGSGTEEPSCSNILHKGKVPHALVPTYLNAADVFVLPTLKEGCCNAIIEAMACGLPVISSDLPFNHDVLNDKNSIMIDPNNVDAIANAIDTLYKDEQLCTEMSAESIKSARSLTIQNRAMNIIKFIKSRIS